MKARRRLRRSSLQAGRAPATRGVDQTQAREGERGMSRCARQMRRRTKRKANRKAGRTAGRSVAAIVPALRPTAIRQTDRRERRASGPRGRGRHRIGAARLHRDPLGQQRRDGESHARAHPRPWRRPASSSRPKASGPRAEPTSMPEYTGHRPSRWRPWASRGGSACRATAPPRRSKSPPAPPPARPARRAPGPAPAPPASDRPGSAPPSRCARCADWPTPKPPAAMPTADAIM